MEYFESGRPLAEQQAAKQMFEKALEHAGKKSPVNPRRDKSPEQSPESSFLGKSTESSSPQKAPIQRKPRDDSPQSPKEHKTQTVIPRKAEDTVPDSSAMGPVSESKKKPDSESRKKLTFPKQYTQRALKLHLKIRMKMLQPNLC